jgi:hypothetical protein
VKESTVSTTDFRPLVKAFILSGPVTSELAKIARGSSVSLTITDVTTMINTGPRIIVGFSGVLKVEEKQVHGKLSTKNQNKENSNG